MKKKIDKKGVLHFLKKIDSKLKGYAVKINLYCVGGTALVLCGDKNFTEDIDIAFSRKFNVPISSITGEIEKKDSIRIDLMADGEFVNYYLPNDYKRHSRKICEFEHINIYVLGNLDLIITKVLAGRRKDYTDVRKMAREFSRKDLMKRFKQYKIKKNKKQEVGDNLKEFISNDS